MNKKYRVPLISKTNALLLLSLIILGIIRGLMLFFKAPLFLYKTNLFNSNFFAVSNISPSLGDYLFNSIFLLFVTVTTFFWIKKFDFYTCNIKIVSVFAICISIGSLYFLCDAILQIYSGSQYLMDLKLNGSGIGLEFKLASLAIFLIRAAIYLTIQYCIISKIKVLKWYKNQLIFSVFLTSIIGLFAVYFQMINIYLLLGHLLYLYIVLFFDLSISIKNYHYKATILIVVSSIFCSFLGTYTHYTQEEFSDFTKKQQFGREKLLQNDPMSEFLIEISNESIKNSSAIKLLLSQPVVNFDLVDTEISKMHLKNWFDKYDININYYGKNGENLKFIGSKLIETQWEFYIENGQKTIIENLYLITSGRLNKTKKYVYRTKIELKNSNHIDLIIVLNTLRERGKERSENSKNEFDFEYKIFQKKVSEYNQSQIFIKPNELEKRLLNDKSIFTKVLVANGIAYAAVESDNGNTVLVFSPVLPNSDVFRTFLFLFILLVLAFISCLIGVVYFFGGNSFNESYATKIQVYFGLAFLIPLFITLIVVFKLISKSHFESENLKQEKAAFDIKKQIISATELYRLTFENKYFWQDLLLGIANDFDVNIKLFSADGKLISSADIFVNKFDDPKKDLSNGMIKQIVQLRDLESLIVKSNTEQDLYNLYQPIYSINGKLLGFFTIPFYRTNSFENNETSELFGSFLSAFAVIFLLFLVVSISISNQLIKPLRLITNYLKNTDLKNSNQPIEIKGQDEIGLLVEGYNRMLAKIEEGKKEISASEKQTAWLDIAKQVAHEIKNPLTPMKLSLQHLQNILGKEKEIDKGKVLSKISSLLYNIDNISEIVDSFMEFAKMPLPKNVKIDFLKSIHFAYELHSNIEGIMIQIDSKIKKAFILGDEKVLSQIINNLIINALQAISEKKAAQIIISLTKVDFKYLLKISDNGSGISEGLSKKVFLPNFTTKTDGLGIGLSLAKWGIENMNGKIWFESEVEIGSTFFIEMPVLRD